MRTRHFAATAVLLLVLAPLASAQGQQTAAGTAAPAPSLGTIDFGPRITGTDGDEARYERYRDLRTGVNLNLDLEKEFGAGLFGVELRNVGYRDARYAARVQVPRLRARFAFDQTPLNYFYDALSPWSEAAVSDGTATLTLDPATRLAVQNRTVIGVPQTRAQATAGSIYNTLARQFELRQRRDTLVADVAYDVTSAVTAMAAVNTYSRTGEMPWGASFAFNVANEVPRPIDERTTDLTAGLEWGSTRGMLRVAWDGSWFNNDILRLQWDNPFRATDWNQTPGTGYDPNAYINGNGPARGLQAMPPSNTMQMVSATGMIKLPARSSLNGTLAFVRMEQDEALIPWTINPVIANPAVYARFPHLATLPRDTAEVEVTRTSATLNFSTRPHRLWGVTARYRYEDRRDNTPEFSGEEYVRFDAVPEECPGCVTEHFDLTRNQLDVNASITPWSFTQFRVGYGLNKYDHSHRYYGTLTDNTFRASVDTVGNRFFSVRALYEYTQRSGSDFQQPVTVVAGMRVTGEGAQPSLRYYDDSEFTRNRGSVMVTLSPVQLLDFTVSYWQGKNTYDDPGQYFGLLSDNNWSVNFGVNVTPLPTVTVGANYGREEYSSFMRSRNANPPPDPTWVDVGRDWSLDTGDTVNMVSFYLDALRTLAKTDIRVAFDRMDSKENFSHSGPRIASLGAIGQFIPLPDQPAKWNRLTADVRYYLTTRFGVGAAWWWERFRVEDWATIDSAGPIGFFPQTGIPRVDWLGGIITGYGVRNYTGNTAFVRAFYMF